MVKLYSKSQEIGWQAPDFSLISIDGNKYSLSDFLSKKSLLVVFTCNHCPYAKASWPTIINLYKKYSDDLEIVAISSNDVSLYPDDSFEEMQKFSKQNDLQFQYLYDEDQSVAKSYDAQCTPDPFLFKVVDGHPQLYYHGRFNDNWRQPDQVKEESMDIAIKSLISRGDAPSEQIPSMGCSIKWIER